MGRGNWGKKINGRVLDWGRKWVLRADGFYLLKMWTPRTIGDIFWCRQGTSPTPLHLSGQRIWPHTLRDVYIARNPTARGHRAPRDPPLSRRSSVNAGGVLARFDWRPLPCGRLLWWFCGPTAMILPWIKAAWSASCWPYQSLFHLWLFIEWVTNLS